MILRAIDIVELQYFLMDGARRYVATTGEIGHVADDLLASAAALDYALLLSSESGGEALDDALPVARSLRETMAKAALAALAHVERIVRGSDAEFAIFVARHRGRADGIFGTIATLRARGVITDDEVAFRALMLADDTIARGGSAPSS